MLPFNESRAATHTTCMYVLPWLSLSSSAFAADCLVALCDISPRRECEHRIELTTCCTYSDLYMHLSTGTTYLFLLFNLHADGGCTGWCTVQTVSQQSARLFARCNRHYTISQSTAGMLLFSCPFGQSICLLLLWLLIYVTFFCLRYIPFNALQRSENFLGEKG